MKHVGFVSEAKVEAVWDPKNPAPQQEVVNKDLSGISNVGGTIAESMPPRNKFGKSGDKRRTVCYEYHITQLISCSGQLEKKKNSLARARRRKTGLPVGGVAPTSSAKSG